MTSAISRLVREAAWCAATGVGGGCRSARFDGRPQDFSTASVVDSSVQSAALLLSASSPLSLLAYPSPPLSICEAWRRTSPTKCRLSDPLTANSNGQCDLRE